MLWGPRPCISSCIRMWVKKASKETSLRSAAGRATPAMGTSTFSNLASWTFLSITRLLPFSFTTRSSLGRLKAAVCTPRLASPEVKTMSMTRMGASAPSFGLRSAGSMGRWFSMSCSSAPKRRELRRVGVVAQADEGLEGRLVVEPPVLVDLVGPDGGLDGRVQLHPGHVAGVVVVGDEGRRPGLEVRLERGLGGRGRRLAQQLRGPRQLALVLEAVGHGREAPGAAAPDGGEEAAHARGLRRARLLIQASTSALVAPAG